MSMRYYAFLLIFLLPYSAHCTNTTDNKSFRNCSIGKLLYASKSFFFEVNQLNAISIHKVESPEILTEELRPLLKEELKEETNELHIRLLDLYDFFENNLLDKTFNLIDCKNTKAFISFEKESQYEELFFIFLDITKSILTSSIKTEKIINDIFEEIIYYEEDTENDNSKYESEKLKYLILLRLSKAKITLSNLISTTIEQITRIKKTQQAYKLEFEKLKNDEIDAYENIQYLIQELKLDKVEKKCYEFKRNFNGSIYVNECNYWLGEIMYKKNNLRESYSLLKKYIDTADYDDPKIGPSALKLLKTSITINNNEQICKDLMYIKNLELPVHIKNDIFEESQRIECQD